MLSRAGPRSLPPALQLAARASRLRLRSRRCFVLPPRLEDVFSNPLEVAAEQGRQAINTALALSGSSVKFRGSEQAGDAPREAPPAARDSSLFWDPYKRDSPFRVGREAFLAQRLAKAVDSRDLVPECDIERYVDLLLSTDVLSNVSLPPGIGRQLYIRIVRIVQRVILNAASLVEGQVLGKNLRLLKDSSVASELRHRGGATLDSRVMRLLAKRTCEDHDVDGTRVESYWREFGLPTLLIERLYEDIIALSVRLVLDVSLTFQVRCLGHSLTCQITPDEMLHMAPGWEVALEQGVFGLFDDGEKRRWANLFVEDLLKDEAVRVPQLPEGLQRQTYTQVTLVLLSLAETALNHFRVHVAGMAFRPVLLDGDAPVPK